MARTVHNIYSTYKRGKKSRDYGIRDLRNSLQALII